MQPTFRDELLNRVPRWLRVGTGAEILFAIGGVIDGFADATVAGIKSRFPNVYSPESLPVIGRERRIRRGLTETDAVYASRLRRWLDDHRRRGSPYTMLAQLHAHFAPNNFPIQLVYYTGRRYSMDVAGVVTVDDITWSPDLETTRWARWWLFYEWPDAIGTDGVWDDAGVWDDGGVWDFGALTIDQAIDLRLVPTEWNNAKSLGSVVLLSDGWELWDYPLGTWDDAGGFWSESGPVKLEV